MFYMKEKLGAWQIGNAKTKGKVEFKVFFPKGSDPKIKNIHVVGDFQNQLNPACKNWDFSKGFKLSQSDGATGTFFTFRSKTELKTGFYQYKYLITFKDNSTRIVSDPCTRYSGSSDQNAAFVIGGSTPGENKVKPLANGRKALSELVIYELHIHDFVLDYNQGKEAPLAAIVHKLDYIKNLGFNAILFMPWTGWPHEDYSWGYEPFHFFSVAYSYANSINRPSEKLSWLKLLINECHKRDIHVIMDGVYNHVSKSFPYKYMYHNQEDCPYTGIYEGSFSGLEDLDFHNACTNEFIRDVCLYWIEVFKIDGIRFDNTVNFYKAGDTHGLEKILEELETQLVAKGEVNFSLTIEHLQKDACDVVNNTFANSFWDNALYEFSFDALWQNQISPRLINALNNRQYLKDAGHVPTIYLSNHDHSQIACRAGSHDGRGAMMWYKTQPYVIALYTSSAIPLVHAGAEFGEDYYIPENDEGTGRRILSRPIRWKQSEDKIGKSLQSLYKCLADIRRDYEGLRSANFYPQKWEEWQTQFNPEEYGMDTNRQLVIYHRWGNTKDNVLQRFMIVLNFSDHAQDLCVPFPSNGTWTDLLSNLDGAGLWKPQVHDYQLCFQVGSNWGHIFFQ